MYLDYNKLDAQSKFLIKQHQNEVKAEDIAVRVNSLEDLYSLKASVLKSEAEDKNKELAREIQKRINSILQECKENDIDIPATLSNFFKMKDSNQIFDYLIHLKQNTINSSTNI